jgi:hypothetical protein
MARMPSNYIPTEEDRRVIRKWRFGIAIFYGVLVLAVVTMVGARHHLLDGSQDVASTARAHARVPATH